MDNIRLLDCTLRDGGHVNNSIFGFDVIKSIIEDLVNARMDIIEVGFLCDEPTSKDVSKFSSITELKQYLPDNMGISKLAVMADNVSVSELEPYDGTVEYIRLSFRKNEFAWAEKSARILKDKGYKVFINPIHGSSITDKEYLQIIDRVNRIEPYGFSIVDTFGAMRKKDLGRLYFLVENNLNKEISIGIHLHENLGIAYTLAQYILEIAIPTRNIVIDGSLYGMGKVPGNLCIEQMLDHMNDQYGMNYYTEPVYDAIDEFIVPIKERVTWGYSIQYALSGQCAVHRTYAEYLGNKHRLRTKDIRRLLNMIDEEHKEVFDNIYIEELYSEYINVEYDDQNDISQIKEVLKQYSAVLILAPGASINQFKIDKIARNEVCIISVNFIDIRFDADFYFFTNAKRLAYVHNIDSTKLIVTSNLKDDSKKAHYVLSRNELSYNSDIYCDDSVIMLLSLLKRIGMHSIYVAGFDGYREGKNNFYIEQFERKLSEDEKDKNVRGRVLKELSGDFDITFLTPSLYESFCNNSTGHMTDLV
ncbi:MAG: aldolase catalytic domain-containing protein [Lachnospiraceae bacterium]|nr:aldolase catalytic domain-containing protein [Lachnospiraceae bacterium]